MFKLFEQRCTLTKFAFLIQQINLYHCEKLKILFVTTNSHEIIFYHELALLWKRCQRQNYQLSLISHKMSVYVWLSNTINLLRILSRGRTSCTFSKNCVLRNHDASVFREMLGNNCKYFLFKFVCLIEVGNNNKGRWWYKQNFWFPVRLFWLASIFCNLDYVNSFCFSVKK